MKHKITLKNTIPFKRLSDILRKIEFRGLYAKNGLKIKPYEKAQFSIATIYPAKHLGDSPVIKVGGKEENLFSPQPTIYLNQTEIIRTVNNFLLKNKMAVNDMDYAVEYDWENRGTFHMLPPIVEKHTYHLSKGFIDLEKLKKTFNDFYIKDAKNSLHRLSERYLGNYFIDEVSSVKHLDVFNSNSSLINYGLQFNGKNDFYIVCDGMHRIDYALEHMGKPVKVILVESGPKPLVPYYAFPTPFHPTIRLSSKQSEKMYPKLERDKIHILNDFIKKTLHYDWAPAGLNVSKLRSNAEIN